MKKLAFTIVAAICCLGVSGQEKVTKANYALAERFSAKKVNQMVFSTRVMPNWFRDGDRFWYEWKTPQGTAYYLVDPAKGTRSEIFDMEKLAMQVTEQVRYPFDAAHIPMRNLKLKEDRYFHFDIVSGLNKDKDTTYFRYDIVTRKLDTVGKEKKKYPMWASVSPDGKVGVFAKGSNLWIMDSTNLRKAAVNEKDIIKLLRSSGIVEDLCHICEPVLESGLIAA